MSTLASLSPDLNQIPTAVFKVLEPDATLQGTTYLDGAKRVVKGRKATPRVRNATDANGLRKARLHCFLGFVGLDMDTVGVDATLELRAVVGNRHFGVTAESGRLGRILERAGELVVGHGVFTATGYNFHASWLETGTDALIDEKAPDESYQSWFVRIRVRKI